MFLKNPVSQSIGFLYFTVLFFSCGRPPEDKCVLDPENKVEIRFNSLEDSLLNFKSKQQLVNFFSHHTVMRDVFFGRQNYPNDSAFINQLFSRFHHPSFDTLLMETKKIFGNGQALKEEFQVAFGNLRYYYPDVKIPRIETVITGLESDIVVSDSLVIVGLDWYLGKKAKYRPKMYEYMLRRYEKNFIVPSVLLLMGIKDGYNKTDVSDESMLAEMIAYGKAYYFAKHMLPCLPDSVFIGYSNKEIEGAKANQDIIWKKLVDAEALFSTSPQIKQRFVWERPKVYEIGNECPGRIGIWVGWQIVNEFMNRNSYTSLPELMGITNAQQVLKGSKYSTKVSKESD